MNERDPELDKLYREHAREEPPSALDAKILAAAHRAVESGPRKMGEATRPQRWWMPLAAAAAIGVVAIGVVQQMPKDTPIDATSVAPMTAGSPPAAPTPPARSEPAPAAPAPSSVIEDTSRKQKAAKSVAPAPATPAAKPAMRQEAPRQAARENKLPAAPQPFPASPAPDKTEPSSAEAKRDAPAEQQAFTDARKDVREERAAAAPSPAPPAAPAVAAAPAPAARMRAQADSAGAVAQLSKNVESEMQQRARDPDAWIARIRKLRDDGNTAQAVRELREFRALVPDAERRLPADLKSLQP